jgi:hypothetical protein
MSRLRTVNFALAILLVASRGVQAHPIHLLSYEGGTVSNDGGAGGVGGLSLRGYSPLTLDYSSRGGSLQFVAGSISPGGPDGLTPSAHPINAEFFFNLGAPAPGSTDAFGGPVVGISGQVTGLLTGPGVGGVAWRWSGGYSGTATSASLDPFHSQDVSQLPTPLLDVLNHPDHFHVSVVVDGGDRNNLDVTLTFDPPLPEELPEPTALITLVAGSAAVSVRGRKGRVEKA